MLENVFPASESKDTLRFGRYEVLFRIAAGGMAEVYAARMMGEGGFEKPVALKRMLPTLAEDERFVEMFLDEGKLAAHISSPHVVQTLDLGRAEDDSLYLVMELVVGVSLAALVRAVLRSKSKLSAAVAVEILSQAAAGLHDAHEARTMYGQPLEIVHRDISPQNILVDVSGRVRITDFGVARALERATHTQSGEVKGKIGYFAPEQVRGKNVDRRTDIFAMGICAWETIAGQRLFQGDNPAQTLDMVMSMPVPRLDALRPDVPSEVADAIAKALERDQNDRFQTAGEFAETLRYATRPAGAKGVAELVRSHGGESLMKLEEGLRARSPTSASRVRRAEQSTDAKVEPTSPSRASRASLPQPAPDPAPFVMAPIPIELDEPRPAAPSNARWAMAGAGGVAAFLCLGTIGWGIVSYANSTTVVATPLERRTAPGPSALSAPAALSAPVAPTTVAPTTVAPTTVAPTTVAPTTLEAPAPTTVPEVVQAPPSATVEGPPGRRVVPVRRDVATNMQTEPPITRAPEPEVRRDPPPVVERTESMTAMMSSGLMGLDEFEDDIQ